MKDKVNKLIAENNRLREKLNPENLAYYEKFITYFRMKNLVKNNLEVEETLMEVLKNLLAAQKEGVSAKDYLGKKPEALAEELLQNISTYSFKEIFENGLAAFAIFLLFSLSSSLFSPAKSPIILGHWMLSFLLFIGCLYSVFYLLAKSVYHKKTWLAFIPVLIFLGLNLLISTFIPAFWVILLGPAMKLLILSFIFLGALIFIFKGKFYEFLPVTVVLFALALSRLNFQMANWLATSPGNLVGFLAIVLAGIATFIIAKKRYPNKK